MAKRIKEGLKEMCRKCSASEFSISATVSQNRYCAKCNNVWAPMTKEQLEVEGVRNDNAVLKGQVDSLKKEIQLLKKKYMSAVPKNTDLFN